MNQRGNLWVWVGVVVLVIIIILAFVWKPSVKAPSTGSASSTTGAPVYAPQGSLVQGFPPDLILDAASTSTVSNSYSVKYTGTVNQYTAIWDSSLPLDTIFSDYQTYLTAHGWKLSNLMTAYQGSRGLHAETASSTIGLAIIDAGKVRTVTLSYVTK